MKILYLPNCYSQQRQREKKANIYPVLMAMEAEWYRKQGHTVHWGRNGGTQYNKIISEPEGLPFLSLPHPDRIFTKAKEYTSGNYKYLPGTHMQVANGCWWGKCTFCVEQNNKWEVRPVEDVMSEIEECVVMGFKEVFNDSGTFPVGKWLSDFCNAMIASGLNKRIRIGCNLRAGAVTSGMCQVMELAGFRMILMGLESANQKTLNRINKGIGIEVIKYSILTANQAGLDIHISCMFGYPFETGQDAIRTLKLVWWLLRKGYAKTAQASFYNPPEGGGNENHRKYVSKLYNVAWYPDFWLTKLRDIRNVDDIKYLWRQIKAGIWKQ